MGVSLKGIIAALVLLNVLAWGSKWYLPNARFEATEVIESPEADRSRPDAGDLQVSPTARSASTILHLPREEAAQRTALAVPDESVAPTSDWIAAQIEDLRDDPVRGNAMRAMHRLSRSDASVVAPLTAALDSDDHQQRHLAAILLQRRDVDPSDRLLEVSLEALRMDDLPLGADHYTPSGDNEGFGTMFLSKHFDRVRMQLQRGLNSTDRQESFLCAYLLTKHRDFASLAESTRILTQHLNDNSLRGDARLSADALYTLGESARPYLRFAEPTADDQGRNLLRLIEYDIVNQPSTDADYNRRAHQNRDAYLICEPRYPRQPMGPLHMNRSNEWQASTD